MKNYNPNKQFGISGIIAALIILAILGVSYTYVRDNGQAGPWGQAAADKVTFNIFGK